MRGHAARTEASWDETRAPASTSEAILNRLRAHHGMYHWPDSPYQNRGSLQGASLTGAGINGTRKEVLHEALLDDVAGWSIIGVIITGGDDLATAESHEASVKVAVLLGDGWQVAVGLHGIILTGALLRLRFADQESRVSGDVGVVGVEAAGLGSVDG